MLTSPEWTPVADWAPEERESLMARFSSVLSEDD
jgi:hypothetical protein